MLDNPFAQIKSGLQLNSQSSQQSCQLSVVPFYRRNLARNHLVILPGGAFPAIRELMEASSDPPRSDSEDLAPPYCPSHRLGGRWGLWGGEEETGYVQP